MKAILKNIFQGTPDGYANFFRMCVCLLIPVVGFLALQGYCVRRFSNEKEEPLEFSFGSFGEYLKVGVWPFFANLFVYLISIPFGFVCFLPVLLLIVDSENPVVIVSVFVLIMLLSGIVGLAYYLVCFPVILRAALTQSLDGIFDFRWIGDYIKKVGLTYMVKWIFIFLIATVPLIFIGFAVLVIGSIIGYVAHIAFLFYLTFQFYNRYQEQGGELIRSSS